MKNLRKRIAYAYPTSIMADYFQQDGYYIEQYESALNKLGFKVERRDIYMGKTLATAKRLCPKRGTFLINTRSHVTCIRDGVMVDWAADNNSRKRIRGIHEVIKNKRG